MLISCRSPKGRTERKLDGVLHGGHDGGGECHGIGGDGGVSGRRNGMVVPITTAHFGRDASGVASDEGMRLRGLLPLVSMMQAVDHRQGDDF